MKIIRNIRIHKNCGHLEKGIYDGVEVKNGYKIFHHTGWYFIDKKFAITVQDNIKDATE